MRGIDFCGKKLAAFRVVTLLVVMVVCAGALTGCGDGITEETSLVVTEKIDKALELYADIEKLVQDNSLAADESFVDMKAQLTDMSARVRERIADTTEEEGQKAIVELDAIIKNLTEVKGSVQKTVDGMVK